MIEAISRILDAVAKYAWGVLVLSLFVILVPPEAARSMGLQVVKQDYLGFWWLGLIFSGAICIGSVFSWLGKRISSSYGVGKQKQAVLKRLQSLDPAERCWIAFCLLKNVQTLNATDINPTAHSLMNKGILTHGSGNALDLPYHICDYVWEYMKENSARFLPPEKYAAILRRWQSWKSSP